MRIFRTIALCASLQLTAALAPANAADETHPLAIHMHHWLAGSAEWRTPNPDYDPKAAPCTAPRIKEFAVNWRWADSGQHLEADLYGVAADGETTKFWKMFMFYNPVTEEIIFKQVGRGGAFIEGGQKVLKAPSPYGEAEIMETIDYWPNGSIKETRHENIFVDAETQQSNVFEKDENGEWKLKQQWVWKRVP